MAGAEIGVYGLGTMGSALALNLAEKGVAVAVSSRDATRIAALGSRAGALASRMRFEADLPGFVAALSRPRLIVMMIAAGRPVDEVIARLLPLLARGDVLVDAGNSDFNDTRRRAAALAGEGIEFLGMGVSGGADGARHGPSMMVGGSAAGWARLRPIAESAAARYGGDPCVARLGPDGAGHFVKTVHNGIEYADMQMIAEIYGLLRDGRAWSAARIAEQFAAWDAGPLASFLTAATAQVLRTVDDRTGRPLVDVILDRAGQKGTGRWTVIEALKLGQSVSAIAAAVAARGWSAETSLREVAADKLTRARIGIDMPGSAVLGRALLAGRILAHAQGFELLDAASRDYGWGVDLARVAEIWRAGCIIRSALLDDLARALRQGGDRAPLVLAPDIRVMLAGTVGELRQTVAAAVQAGLPVPALGAALAWYDSLRQARGTANLIQAQRDFFGAHGFERTDMDGRFHGRWPAMQED